MSVRQQMLPSAAELLSTTHSSLGSVAILMLLHAVWVSHKQKSAHFATDYLDVQYLPSSHDLTDKHQGRKRQFPHVDGDFATHVYIVGRLCQVMAFTKRHCNILSCSIIVAHTASFATRFVHHICHAAHCTDQKSPS